MTATTHQSKSAKTKTINVRVPLAFWQTVKRRLLDHETTLQDATIRALAIYLNIKPPSTVGRRTEARP